MRNTIIASPRWLKSSRGICSRFRLKPFSLVVDFMYVHLDLALVANYAKSITNNIGNKSLRTPKFAKDLNPETFKGS